MTENDNQRMLNHPKMPLSAPEYVWKAAGYNVYTNSDEVSPPSGYSNEVDKLLPSGMARFPGDPDRAICWAAEESHRRQTERTRVTAQAREAEAISALARALSSCTEEEVLKSLLGRLTERTQYAVKKQLGSA